MRFSGRSLFSASLFCAVCDAFVPRRHNFLFAPRIADHNSPSDFLGPSIQSPTGAPLGYDPLVVLFAKKKKGNAKSAALEALEALEENTDLNEPLSQKEQKDLKKKRKKEKVGKKNAKLAALEALDALDEDGDLQKPLSKKEQKDLLKKQKKNIFLPLFMPL